MISMCIGAASETLREGKLWLRLRLSMGRSPLD